MPHQNIRGLFHKISDIQIILHEFNLYVLTLSKTHINSNNYNEEDSLYNITGQNFIKKNRIKGPDGGVVMIISDTLKWQRRYDRERNHYYKDLINENVNNPRQFWKNIKEKY